MASEDSRRKPLTVTCAWRIQTLHAHNVSVWVVLKQSLTIVTNQLKGASVKQDSIPGSQSLGPFFPVVLAGGPTYHLHRKDRWAFPRSMFQLEGKEGCLQPRASSDLRGMEGR